MKRTGLTGRLWRTIGFPALAAIFLSGLPALAAEDTWPKRFDRPQGTLVMYQPQLEDYKDNILTSRAAVSVKKKEWKTPVFGAVWLSGRVHTDRDTRMATISEVKVTDAKFPEATPEQLEKLKTFINTETLGRNISISLDRLLAALEVLEKEHAADRGLKNDPPRIIFVNHPAVLVSLDGDPKLQPVPKSSLMRVANTPFIMLYDPAGKTYYLKGGEDWLAAPDLKAPWKDVDQLPPVLKTLDAEITKTAPGRAAPKIVEAKAGKMPEIIVSTVPAELLATDGEPEYTPIKDTNLLYMSNTENAIFMDTTTQEYYALISGRWFKTKSLSDGPWAYVAPDKLPGDFAKIPEGSAKGFVLVSVAGTSQAREAVLENSIPQTAVIDRKKAATKVEYAGEPKFEQVPGTNLEYAVNTGTTVFKQRAKYFALDQGVWYEADSPNGPWTVAVNPPQEVDRIPPSNPRYNAKYVKVYDSTADTVTVGYTPGYTGSYVDSGTVVYGTGYPYQGYSAPDAYIPPPATYGYGAAYDPYASSWGYQAPYYNPGAWMAAGLTAAAVGVGVAAATSNWWGPHGYYGGGWWGAGGYNNININNIHNNVINPRPWPGPGPRPGPHPGPGPGPHPRPIVHPVVGPEHRPNIYNRPGNQNLLASRPGTPATRPAAGVAGERPGTRPGTPGQAGKPRPETKPAQATRPKPAQPKAKPAGGKNNVVADRQGNVYKRDQQGNWQQRQGNQWSKPQASTRPQTTRSQTSRPTTRPEAARPATRPSFDTNRMNQEFAARQRGEARSQNFQRAQSSRPTGGGSRPSFSRPSGGGSGAARGGGGTRGGGGGGRRR